MVKLLGQRRKAMRLMYGLSREQMLEVHEEVSRYMLIDDIDAAIIHINEKLTLTSEEYEMVEAILKNKVESLSYSKFATDAVLEVINNRCCCCNQQLKPEDRFTAQDGKIYCDECASELLNECDHCGKWCYNEDLNFVGLFDKNNNEKLVCVQCLISAYKSINK